jgi:hypothetical protein
MEKDALEIKARGVIFQNKRILMAIFPKRNLCRSFSL